MPQRSPDDARHAHGHGPGFDRDPATSGGRMTIAVYAATGASGHIGRFAVQQLLARGAAASDVVAVVCTGGKVAGLAARELAGRVRAKSYAVRPVVSWPARRWRRTGSWSPGC